MSDQDTVSFDYAGAEVLVTGGSNGIGNAIARGFRDAGAAVTITGTRTGAADYDTDIAGMAYERLDMEDGAGIEALGRSFDALDVLVNNAGNTVRGEAAWEPDGFEKVIDINLNGSYRMAWAVLELLKASRGSVVNIASMTSYFAAPRVPGYGASKGAVMQLTKTLAAAWAPFGIRVNAIAPGWIRTNLTELVQAEPTLNDPILARTPMGRWGEPEDMAGTALFLASSAAGFLTGVTIPVDGGFSSA
jgi:NAD(P)-dependent dehydrogenase (short-subunit alcohol dehydrogenase family)